MLCPRLTLVSAVSSAIRLFTCEPLPQHSARAHTDPKNDGPSV